MKILLEAARALPARARPVLELPRGLLARARARGSSLEVLASNARCSQASNPSIA